MKNAGAGSHTRKGGGKVSPVTGGTTVNRRVTPKRPPVQSGGSRKR